MGYSSLKVVLGKGSKRNKKGIYSIYIRVIMNRQAHFFNLGRRIEKIHWQGKENAWIKSSCRHSAELNILIKRRVEELTTHALRVEVNGFYLTLEHLKQAFQKQSIGTFNDFLTEYMRTKTKGLKVNTIKKYKTFERYLGEFNDTISFPSITEHFIVDFCHWLHSKKKLHGSTIHKYLDPFRIIVRQAYKEGYYDRDPFYKVAIPYSEKNKNRKEYLSILEIKRLKEAAIPNDRPALEKVREWFLFSLYCGIRYKDLSHLIWADFVESDQGLCLKGRRVKNGNEYHVPLYRSKNAVAIFARRRAGAGESTKPNDRIFTDVISEQKYNEHLKELASLVGISKNLKNSSARDAFGKYWARMGVPPQHLARMMGHENEKTTKKYYDIDGDDINEHLQRMDHAGLIDKDF